MSDFQHYLNPAEAAAKIGLTAQQLIERVLWFDFEPERIPIYCRVAKSCLAHWALDPEFDHAGYTGPTEGNHELSAGKYLEIHPHDGHELAARPNETHLVQRLRSPPYAMGSLPARALIILWKADAIAMKYADSWIGEAGLRIATSDEGRRTRQVSAIVAAAILLNFNPLAIPFGGKRRVFKQCVIADKTLIHEGSFNTVFEKAWKIATSQGLIRSAAQKGGFAKEPQ